MQRLLTAIGVMVLMTGMIAPLAHAQDARARLLRIGGTALRVEKLPGNITRIIGEMKIDTDDWQLNANQVDISKDEARIVPSGDAVFVSANGRIEAERVEFDIATETGTFYGVSMKYPAR